MRHSALSVIQNEHQSLAAMLRSMSLLVAQARRDDAPPPFDVLRAMLFYVDEFPERMHHTKETQLLFPKLLARCPELAETIARLEADHTRGEAAVRALEHALLAFEVMGEPRRQAFELALERYIDDYIGHMTIEEREILPAARRALSDADWDELDAAFATNRDPLTGHTAEEQYRPLFRKIVQSAPAPIGLG